MLKDIENQNCRSFGFCMADPRVNALNELLTNEIKQIAFYTVKIGEYKITNKELVSKCIEALCIDFSNTNFNEKNFIDMYQMFVNQRIEARRVYNDIFQNSNIPYETITNPIDEEVKNSITGMIKKGQRLLKNNHLFVSKQTEQLFELVNVLVKDTAHNIIKIKDFDGSYTKYDYEILRFLNITNFPSTRAEKLKRRIKEFVEISYQVRLDLQKILENNYGPKTSAKVNLSPFAGKSILVSGDNFKELEMILETSKNEDINVYTHDMLFMAHNYTKFREYKNLKGHFGTNNPRFDFTRFKGVIYVTKNYEQRIDSIVKASIFASNRIMPKGVSKIKDNNFEPLINAAKIHEGYDKNIKRNIIDVPYDKEKITKLAEGNETSVIAGSDIKENEDSAVRLFSPSELSLLFDLCQKSDKKFSVTFSSCYMQVLIFAFILREKFDYEIQFAKCPEYYINPNLISCLKNEYNIKFSD